MSIKELRKVCVHGFLAKRGFRSHPSLRVAFPRAGGRTKFESVCVQNIADSLQNCATKALPRNAGEGGALAPGGGELYAAFVLANKNFTHTCGKAMGRMRKALIGKLRAIEPFALSPFPFRDGGTDIVKNAFRRETAANFRTPSPERVLS